MNKKKLSVITATLLIAFTTGNVIAFADSNISTEKECIKVFVGTTERNTKFSESRFLNDRIDIITENSSENPLKIETAVVTFNTYLTPDEADSYVASLQNATIKSIFLGIPNVDGRSIIESGTGTISNRVETAYCDMLSEDLDNETRELILSHKNNAKVFALTIETTNSEIAEINQMDTVAFVDVYNYPEAERLAEIRNVPVSYIAVPEKPDNSH